VNPPTSFSIYPLGDSAITIDLGNYIDEQLNRRALALYDWLQARRFPGVIDIIVAYSSVSVFYDPASVHDSVFLHDWLQKAWQETGKDGISDPLTVTNSPGSPSEEGRLLRIPVCYEGEYAPDLEWVVRQKGLTREEVIALHCSGVYRIYMIGFLPGFPYMGKLADQLEIARKDRPVPVMSGGVGIAGMQTGIYPLNSPGGWQIIGRTPIQLFDRHKDPPILLRTGDIVQFYPVSKAEFLDFSLH
jgi:inhibitor of KinA